MSGDRKRWLIQFVSFNLIGLVNTAIDYAVFQLLVWAGLFYIGAQVISFGAGMVNSFIMNRSITFKHKQRTGLTRAQVLRFAALNGGVLLCSLLLLYLFVDLGGLHYWLSKLLVTAVTVVINFAGSRHWVFREEGLQAPE